MEKKIKILEINEKNLYATIGSIIITSVTTKSNICYTSFDLYLTMLNFIFN